VSPCFFPVFLKISTELSSLKALMGCKNLFSGTLGKLFIEEEITIGVAALSIAGLSFESIGSDHRSDEDIISVFRESVWDFSGVPVPSWPSINVGWDSGSFQLKIFIFFGAII
jgi:hypothetical protein